MTAPVGAPFAAAPPASIALSPTCGSVGATVQVTGANWPSTGNDITITFDGTLVATVLAANITSGKFTASFSVPPKASRGTPYTVTATEGGGEFVIASANAFFSVPCASITLNPTCGKTGDAVIVQGAGFRSDIVVSITFTPPAGTPPNATTTPGLDGAFNVTIKVPTEPPGTYTVTAVQLRNQATARALFTIPCVKGAIKLNPQVGPPGTVVTVTGTGFPIGAVVKLSWNLGVPLSLASITVGQSQGFQVTVLIFPHDAQGKRTMSAGPDLSAAGAPLFNIATADFLVVPGTAQPKKFAWRR